MARYIYDKTSHVEIPITGDPDPTNFVGTLAQWEALTQAEKNLYDSVDLTDDYNDITEDINDIKNDIGVISNLNTDDKTNLVAAVNEVNSKAAGSGGVMIAGTEETSTASRAYLPEQYLIYNEFLYRVIGSIALGDTLVPDTNIKQVTIGGELSSHLSINGVPFYFDSHDGQYGYNTSSSRGADTFVPFSKKPVYLGTGYSFDVSSYSGYDTFTKDNFIVGVKSIPTTAATWYSSQWNHKARVLAFTLDYSYDSSTGIMTVTSYQITVGCGGDSWDSVTTKGNCEVFAYLVP